MKLDSLIEILQIIQADGIEFDVKLAAGSSPASSVTGLLETIGVDYTSEPKTVILRSYRPMT